MSEREGAATIKQPRPDLLEAASPTLSDLGEKARIIPAPEPRLEPCPIRHVGSAADRPYIPVSEPRLDGREAEYVAHAVESNWISSAGPFIGRFEETYSRACGASHGIACSSGTAALHLALAALGVGPGDEVIVPTFTMVATANAVRYTGASPVFVDSAIETWNIDLAAIERAITQRTKAIIAVHTYGNPVDMDPIIELAGSYGIHVVEDAAQAHGATYKGRAVGSLGDVACFSFYANKIITTGEGGMLTTNNAQLAAVARELRDHAFSTDRHFWHRYLGFNYRMTNLQAAVGLAQAERLADLVDIRRKNADRYRRHLAGTPGLSMPPRNPLADNVFWMFSILIQDCFGRTRDQVRERLAQAGIETRSFFIPLHLQPIYFREHGHEDHPVAEELCRTGLYLPSGPRLTPVEIDYICEVLVASRVPDR